MLIADVPNQIPNRGQEDANNNLVGDVCDTLNDRDKDGVPDEVSSYLIFKTGITDGVAK